MVIHESKNRKKTNMQQIKRKHNSKFMAANKNKKTSSSKDITSTLKVFVVKAL